MLNIRLAGPSDVGVLREIGVLTCREHFSAIWSPDGLERFIERDFSERALAESLSDEEGHQWLLASGEGGNPLGFAKLNWNRPDPVLNERGAELQKIYFRASATGQGHGPVLLEQVVKATLRRGETRLWLDVLKSNPGARRFYERHGFRHVGQVPFSTDLGEIGMNVMLRDL